MTTKRSCWKTRHIFLTFALSILLTACGGGGDSNPKPATVLQGVLIDAAVEGVRFVTATQSGLTDANGTFNYRANEIVKFYIGDILLGSASAAATLTPISLVPGATDEKNPQVTNVLRFVQSLDSDSDPSNGIQISATIRSVLASQTLDFSLSKSAFEAAFSSLSGSMLGGMALVTAAAAQAHMRVFLDTLTGGPEGNGLLGSLTVAGADAATIGLSFEPETVIPVFTSTTGNVAWMGGNTNAGNVSRLGGFNLSSLNGQVILLQYNIQDYRNKPLLSFSYSISCWPIAAADCSKINFDTGAKRLVINNVALVDRELVVIVNQATAPITMNGTLYW